MQRMIYCDTTPSRGRRCGSKLWTKVDDEMNLFTGRDLPKNSWVPKCWATVIHEYMRSACFCTLTEWALKVASDSVAIFLLHKSNWNPRKITSLHHCINCRSSQKCRRFPKRIFNNNFWKRCVLHLLLLPDWTSSSGVFRCHGTNARCPGAALERLRHQFSFIFVFAVSHRSIDHLITVVTCIFLAKRKQGKKFRYTHKCTMNIH